jgi:DNA-binding NtrC family response regulator
MLLFRLSVPTMGKPHIGLLEESASLAELLNIALKMAGHVACIRVSIASLFECVSTGGCVCALPRPFDLLILDILVDEPGALAFLAQLDRSLPDLPLIVITASHSELIAQTQRVSAYRVSAKTVSFRELAHAHRDRIYKAS